MTKVRHEFFCTECSKYFDIKLNIALDGNYRIHCPNCQHVHYRSVRKGVITEDRFVKDDCKLLIEDIVPMRSSCRDYQTETRLDQDHVGEGFLHRLWVERFSGRI